MNRRRKIYSIALGVILAQLSIAEVWNGHSPRNFGDCPTCNAATQIPMPLDNGSTSMSDMVANIQSHLGGNNITGFTHGNTLGTLPNTQSGMSSMLGSWNGLASQPQVPVGLPFVAPTPLVIPTAQIPTSQVAPGASYYDAISAASWDPRSIPVSNAQIAPTTLMPMMPFFRY